MEWALCKTFFGVPGRYENLWLKALANCEMRDIWIFGRVHSSHWIRLAVESHLRRWMLFDQSPEPEQERCYTWLEVRMIVLETLEQREQ
jgi:hypothetical protein